MYNDEWMRDNGMLGGESRLGLVRDLLASREAHKLISATRKEQVGDVIARLKRHGISQMPVVDKDRVIGIIQEVDLLNFMLSGVGYPNSSIEPIIQSNFPQVSEETALDEVTSLLTRSRQDAVMVMKGDQAADIITKIDLIDYLLQGNGRGK
jgi:cystathionine beta-synthase